MRARDSELTHQALLFPSSLRFFPPSTCIFCQVSSLLSSSAVFSLSLRPSAFMHVGVASAFSPVMHLHRRVQGPSLPPSIEWMSCHTARLASRSWLDSPFLPPSVFSSLLHPLKSQTSLVYPTAGQLSNAQAAKKNKHLQPSLKDRHQSSSCFASCLRLWSSFPLLH